jgi:uncharacterized protein (DUF1501 family)
MDNRDGEVPMLHLGANKLPLALSGPAGSGGAVSVGDQHTTFRLDLGDDKRGDARRQLLAAVSASPKAAAADDLLAFVQRRQVQTLTAVDTLQDLLDGPGAVRGFGGGLQQKLQLVAGLIARGFGTRIFYVSLDGFDTHAEQGPAHKRLLGELADAVRGFFDTLIQGGYDKRVRLMTFSEFGRRTQENGSRGTDHGAASCLFVAGPSVKGGVVGKHPSLADLEAGDLKFHTDFRRVYATLLDGWLGCNGASVLGAKWGPLPALQPGA